MDPEPEEITEAPPVAQFYVVECRSGWNEDLEGLTEIAWISRAISLRNNNT